MTTHQHRALFIRDLGREGDGRERAVDDFVKLDRDVLTGRTSSRSGKLGPDALPCELHSCKAPTTHVQVDRVCLCMQCVHVC